MVSTMKQMFYECSSLISLDISGFDTEKVRDMSGMFKGLSSLENLDLHTFNTKTCNAFNEIFDGCEKLTIKINREKCENLLSHIPTYVNIEYEGEFLE